MDLPIYTKQQLALRNGQDKPQIWVAYRGIIYYAPHTESVFEKFIAIGKLFS
jgi:predicted heme/steroid binding protein